MRDGGGNKNEGKFRRELKKREVGVVAVGGVFWIWARLGETANTESR